MILQVLNHAQFIFYFGRCLGKHNDLDAGVTKGRHTEEFTEALILSGECDAKHLWQEYGIIADVIVRLAVSFPEHIPTDLLTLL